MTPKTPVTMSMLKNVLDGTTPPEKANKAGKVEHTLTITKGGTSVVYDGSAAQTVEVGGDVPEASTTEAGIVQLAAASGQSESLVMHQKAVTDYVAAQIASAITTALNANY